MADVSIFFAVEEGEKEKIDLFSSVFDNSSKSKLIFSFFNLFQKRNTCNLLIVSMLIIVCKPC